jgi:uncharacterized protein YjbJ (UPF0337 family)
MNNGILRGHWSELRGSLKNQWSQLTDQDLKEISGKEDLLLDKLQEKYGYTQAEAERKIEQFVHRFEPKLKQRARDQLNTLAHIGTTIDNTVKNAPWTTALITGLSGLILGWAFSRTRTVTVTRQRRWFT